MGLSVASQLLGLGQMGDVAANLGTQLLTLKYGRDDETEADLVGLEIAARGGFKPEASVQLWKKMLGATGGGKGQPSFLSTHPSGNNRIQELEGQLAQSCAALRASTQRPACNSFELRSQGIASSGSTHVRVANAFTAKCTFGAMPWNEHRVIAHGPQTLRDAGNQGV